MEEEEEVTDDAVIDELKPLSRVDEELLGKIGLIDGPDEVVAVDVPLELDSVVLVFEN
jgi:hypothetical protein